jgi:SAM-dependent methyltransferase
VTDEVRAMHNAVARSPSDAEASTRDPRTTARQLRRMVRQVQTRLSASPADSVLEVGCGTGILAVPLCRGSRRFVGVDIAEEALAVLDSKLRAAGNRDRAELLHLDFTDPEADLSHLGRFDRIVVYATLHFARDAQAAERLVHRVAAHLNPHGLALFGNLPLAELASEQSQVAEDIRRRHFIRVVRWLLTSNPPVRRSTVWKLRALGGSAARRLRTAHRDAPRGGPSLAKGTTVALSAAKLEDWLRSSPIALAWDWYAPDPGVPMAVGRADLLVRRSTRVP